jgi:hypothetical protein
MFSGNRWQKAQHERKAIISDKATIAVYPISVSAPIKIEGENTILLSLIPGRAHHVLKKVILPDTLSLMHFIVKNFSFYRIHGVLVEKLFYIESVEQSDLEFEHLFVNLKNEICGWKLDDSYRLVNYKKHLDVKEVYEWEYLFEFEKNIKATLPDQESVRAATGGQQDSKEVLASFDAFARRSRFYPLLSPEKLTVKFFVGVDQLSNEQKLSLIAYLLPKNEKHASALFERWNLSPDAKVEENEPLILYAAKQNCPEFTKLLLKKGADPNSTSASKADSLLSLASYYNYKEVVDLLFDLPNFDINPEFTTKIF